MSRKPTGPGGEDELSVPELKLLARRERESEAKRERRARQALERATAAVAPNPDGYTVPAMPAGLSRIRKWLRAPGRRTDTFSLLGVSVCPETPRRGGR